MPAAATAKTISTPKPLVTATISTGRPPPARAMRSRTDATDSATASVGGSHEGSGGEPLITRRRPVARPGRAGAPGAGRRPREEAGDAGSPLLEERRDVELVVAQGHRPLLAGGQLAFGLGQA